MEMGAVFSTIWDFSQEMNVLQRSFSANLLVFVCL